MTLKWHAGQKKNNYCAKEVVWSQTCIKEDNLKHRRNKTVCEEQKEDVLRHREGALIHTVPAWEDNEDASGRCIYAEVVWDGWVGVSRATAAPGYYTLLYGLSIQAAPRVAR